MALYVLSSIELAKGEGDTVSASGGSARVLWPWDIGQGTLEAIGFQYSLPRAELCSPGLPPHIRRSGAQLSCVPQDGASADR